MSNDQLEPVKASEVFGMISLVLFFVGLGFLTCLFTMVPAKAPTPPPVASQVEPEKWKVEVFDLNHKVVDTYFSKQLVSQSNDRIDLCDKDGKRIYVFNGGRVIVTELTTAEVAEENRIKIK